MTENECDIQFALKKCLLEFLQECCEIKIDANHPFFEFLLQKSLLVWKYFQAKCEGSKSFSLESQEIRSCLRDLVLAQMAGRDNKSFAIIDLENTPYLAKQVVYKKWRYEQIAGKDASPKEVIEEFYADMTAKNKWSVYKGYTKLTSWLPTYLHAFLRDSLNQGIRDSDGDAATTNASERNPRDHRHVSFAEGQEIEQESDPQKNMALKKLRDMAGNIFSKLSPKDLQFLCFLRAKRNEGVSQKEIAQMLEIADYKLTRMKIELHKRFFDLLTQDLQTLFPTRQIDSLHEQMSIDDMLVLLGEETVDVHDAGDSSDAKRQPHIPPFRRTASAFRTDPVE